MADSDVHNPKLPGVRTLTEDSDAAQDDDLGVHFLSHGRDKTKVHAPEEPTVTRGNTSSVLSSKDDIFDVGHAFAGEGNEAGTVVTDRKRRKTSFSSMLGDAFSEWWRKTAASLERTATRLEKFKPEEPPTVEAPETRKDVLFAAAQYTKQVPRDDHRIVVEKIKTMTRDAEAATGKPYYIKEPDVRAAAVPTWKHTLDEKDVGDTATTKPVPTLDLRKVSIAPDIESRAITAQTPLPASAVHTAGAHQSHSVAVPTFPPRKQPKEQIKLAEQRIAPEIVRQKDLRAPSLSERPVPKPEPVIVTPRHEISALKPQLAAAEQRPTPLLKAPTQQPQPLPIIKPEPVRIPQQPIPAQAATPTPPPSAPTPRIEPPHKKPNFLTFKFDVLASLSKTILVGIVICGIVLGVGAGVYTGFRFLGGSSTEPIESSATMLPELKGDAVPIVIPPDLGREAVLAFIAEKVHGAAGGMTQFYPIRETSGVRTPLTADAFMRLVAPHAEASFIRQLHPTIIFGSVTAATNEPFLIVRANTFDTGFAGMLAWEPWMSEDLAPLMGPRVTSSLIPTSGVRDPGPPKFIDALTENRSIRILYNERGDERIIYAFINRTTILITTSTAALSALLTNLN